MTEIMLLRRGHRTGNRAGHVSEKSVKAADVFREVFRGVWYGFMLGTVEEMRNRASVEAMTPAVAAVFAEYLECPFQVPENGGCEGGDFMGVSCGGGCTATCLAGRH